MNTPIHDCDIERMRRTVPIVDVIGSFQEVNPRIDGMWEGDCPFHPDTDRALHINIAQGFFRCRSCAAAGDVIAYLMRRGLSFREAFDRLQSQYPLTPQ